MKRCVWVLCLFLALATVASAATPEERALDYFTRERSADGSWTALARPSSVLYNTHAIFLYEYLGRLEEKRPIVNELLKHLWSMQNRDGGFPGYPDGPSDHAITVLAYL